MRHLIDLKSKGIKSMGPYPWLFLTLLLGFLSTLLSASVCNAKQQVPPLEFLKAQELAHKDSRGEVYLGKVLTINYPINSATVPIKYDKLLLELSDVLKTPERRSYRLVIIGYTDNTGPAWLNKKLSLKRAQELKRLLVRRYHVDPSRIIVNGYGPENPIASNKTPSGRAMNRRSEIHVFGDVSEAVKLMFPPSTAKVAEKKPPKPKITAKEKKEEVVPLFKPKKPAVTAKPTPKAAVKPQAKPSRGTPPVVGQLPEALRSLTIKDYFIPSTEKQAGRIRAMLGHVVVVHRGTNEAYFAKTGDIIYENDAVYTLDKSLCRINFLDDDLVSMAANTHFAIDQFEDKREKQKKTSFFSMLKGKAMFFALRLFRYKQMAFRVKTPTAVVGVRGTKFGVHVKWLGKKTALSKQPILASVNTRQAFLIASAAGHGTCCSDVFCMDGLVVVDGKEVPAGFTYHCETGQVTPSDPEYILQFEEDTGVSKRKKRKKEKGKEGMTVPTTPYQELLANWFDDEADITNDQNVPENPPPHELPPQEEEEQEEIPPEQQPPATTGRHMGYFSALLSSVWGVGYPSDLSGTYVSSSAQDFDGESIRADSLNGTDYILLNPGFVNDSTSYITRIVTGYGNVDSGDLGTGYPLEVTELGSNDYMEWGYWVMQSPYPDGDTYPHYIVDTPAWYIVGLTTTDEVLSSLTGTVNYSGPAYGTFWGIGGGQGVRLDGNFSCSVSFDSGSVSEFNLLVTSTDGYSAAINRATGVLDGGQFHLNFESNSWQLTVPEAAGPVTYNAELGSSHGAFYGPTADYVGGAWGMSNPDAGAAIGIYQGRKQ